MAAISLKLVMLSSMCIFTIAPALALWLLSWQEGQRAIDNVVSSSQAAVEDVVMQLRSGLIANASNTFSALFVEPTENVMTFLTEYMTGLGFLDYSLTNGMETFSRFSYLLRYQWQLLHVHNYLAMTTFSYYYEISARTGKTPLEVCEFEVYARMGVDIIANQTIPTLYYVSNVVNANKNASILTYYATDQATGKVLSPLFYMNVPISTYEVDPYTNTITYTNWFDDLVFNENTGQPLVYLVAQLPAKKFRGGFSVALHTTVYMVSTFLRSMLEGSKERLFIFFRSRNGTLIGASHGKFFSHSDVEYYSNNPIANPPPVSQFQRFTPLDSTDPTICSCARQLMQDYEGWDGVPELNTVQTLNGEPYWITSSHITSKMDLVVQMVLLIDVQSKMGAIGTRKSQALSDIHTNNNNLTIILVFIGIAAVTFAVTVSLFITCSLGRLVVGMNDLSVLSFDEEFIESIVENHSKFEEVGVCEHSFVSLQRGIKAFEKYVPKEVVRLMLDGKMERNNIMSRRDVTILFMEIADFSTISEELDVSVLVVQIKDYFDAMCEIIINAGGTLDKFIGDCIMAMWNAPVVINQPEAAACSAALDMQDRLLQLHESWSQAKLPLIRFRAGINQDKVLVGNFGCEHRIAYTSLGDGVNLAARLEAANKYFGTAVLVSESVAKSTSTSNHFCFRKIAHITVPGKEQIVPVYEIVYRTAVFQEMVRRRSLQMFSSQSLEAKDSAALVSFHNLLSNSELSGRKLNKLKVSTEPDPNEDISNCLTNSWRKLPFERLSALVNLYEKGIELFLQGNIIQAEQQFTQCLQVVPDDAASKYLLSQCQKK